MKKIKTLFLYLFALLIIAQSFYFFKTGGNIRIIITYMGYDYHRDVDFILISGCDTVFSGNLDTVGLYVFLPPETALGFHNFKIHSNKLGLNEEKKFFILPVTNIIFDINSDGYFIWYSLLPPRLM